MGSVNANFLPASTGLNLGSSVQEWNGYFNNVTINGIITAPGFGLSSISSTTSPTFDGSQGGTFEMILTGNVTASSAINLVVGLPYTFILIQDVVGNWTFSWPSFFKGAMVIDPTASISNVQQFVFDGTNAFAVSAGVSM